MARGLPASSSRSEGPKTRQYAVIHPVTRVFDLRDGFCWTVSSTIQSVRTRYFPFRFTPDAFSVELVFLSTDDFERSAPTGMGYRKFEIAHAFRGMREVAEASYIGRLPDQIPLNLIAEFGAQET